MVDFDPIEGLVALGVVSREQAEAAARVPLWVSASRVGRLVHAGVDPHELLRALSTLTGIPVASDELIASAARFSLPRPLVRKLRDLTSCPVRRDDVGTVHVLIAEPGARDDIARQLLNFRVYLASEVEVRRLLEQLWPIGTSLEGDPVLDADTEPGEPTLSDSQPPDMPMPPPRAATPPPASPRHAAPPRFATPPPRAPTPPPAPPPRAPTPPSPTLPRAAAPMPAPFQGFHMDVPSTTPGALGHGESVLRTVGKSVERPWEPTSDGAQKGPAPFNLNAARPQGETPPPKASAAFVEDTIEETLRLPASPEGEASGSAPRPAPTPTVRSSVAGVHAAEPVSTRRSLVTAALSGAGVMLAVVALVAGVALVVDDGDAADDVRQRQELLLANARASAEKSDHAWAVAKCDQVIELDRTSRAAAAALLLRGRERLALGDREGLDDVRAALLVPAIDATLRAEAERILAAAERTR